MKIRGILSVMLLSLATMFAQSATPAPDASKPADHPACKHEKMACCRKDKDGNMSKECCKNKGKDCCKKGEQDKKTDAPKS